MLPTPALPPALLVPVPPDNAADWILLVTGAALFLLASWTLVRVFKANGHSKELVSSITSVVSNLEKEHLRETRQYALDHARSLPSAQDAAGHLWSEFDETLVEERDGSLSNSVDARDMFNTETLAQDLVHSRGLAFMPTAITALGVLGTFLGLVFGLYGLNLGGSDEASMAELQSGVQQLISGVSLAFVTSVVGVLFSLILNLIRYTLISRRSREISSLQTKIDNLFSRHTPEASLASIEHSTRDSASALNELHERIGNQLQEAVQGISADMQQAVQGALENALAPMLNDLSTSSHEQAGAALETLLKQFSESFRQSGAAQAESLAEATSGLSESAAGIQKSLESSLAAMQESQSTMRDEVQQAVTSTVTAMSTQHSEMQATVSQLVAAIKDEREQSLTITEKLKDSAAQTSAAVQSASSDLNGSSKNIRAAAEAWTSSAKAMEGHREKMSRELQEVSAKHLEAMGALSGLQELLEKSAGRTGGAAESLESSAKLAEEAFHALQLHQDEYIKGLEDNVQRLSQQMQQWLESYSATVSSQTKERMDQWNTLSLEYASKMKDIANTMYDTVDELQSPAKA